MTVTSFEVGAIFRILDEASPALKKILGQVAKLREAVDAARESMAALGKPGALGLNTATAQIDAITESWRGVTASAKEAQAAMKQASTAARNAVPTAIGGGGAALATGGRARLGHRLGMGGGGAHVGGPAVPIAGGGHLSFGGPTMAAVAAFGWGVDQAAKTQDYVWRLEDISGLPHDETTHAKFRKLLQDFQIKAGYSIDEAGKAALTNIRLFQGTPGGGVDTLDEILSSGAVEARRKGTGLEESVEAGVGLAHQFRAYTPEAIRKLMTTFAGLSTADPRSLTAMKRAAGYSVPTLAQIGVDESSVLLAGTALAGAGIDSSKSGTWIREAITRAMPGIVLGHSASNRKHEEALRKFGLVDANDKPTWFTDGRPDMFKLFAKTSDALQGMTPQDRAAYGRAAFGAQGFGAISVLGEAAVNQRMHQIDSLTKSQAYLDRYNSFGKDYAAGSTMQDFRTALSSLNVTMGEIARATLPAVNKELGDFKWILDGVRKVVPHLPAFPGDPGTPDLMGVAATKVLNGGKDIWSAGTSAWDSLFGRGPYTSPGKTGHPAQPKVDVHLPQQNVTLNIDGTTLAQAIINKIGDIYKFDTNSPAADGSLIFGP